MVYVVDDDYDVLTSLQFLLETEGFEVRTFRSGSALLGSSSGDGVRLTPVGEPRPVELSSGVGSPLGTIVSAEPMGLGPVGSRTLVLSAAAVPPATSTAATVSAAMPPVLFTPPR